MNRWVFFAVGVLLFVNISLASTVKCFYPPKHWQVSVDANDFEPEDFMDEKTILSGNSNDIKITILVEKAIDGTTASERNLYGKRYAEGFGIKESVEEFECGQISCIRYQWKSSSEKSSLKRWGYHGYAVKDDVSFDIHISADMSKHNRVEIVNIIKSFKVEPTEEIPDFVKLFKSAYAPYDNGKDKAAQEKQRVEMVKTFLEKYPDNAEAYLILADHYMLNKEREVAKEYYLSVLKYRKSKLFLSPSSLWNCYDGLGLCYAQTNEIGKAKFYLDAGYNLAKKAKQKDNLAASAYNLACYYGETGDAQKCLRYLSEAIRISKDYQQQAADDSSFGKIKNDSRFIKLVGTK
jgi:tetratricopeptide (TPR) repeat protein